MTLALPMPDHDLVAVDGRGRWCGCGEAWTPEHLFDAALALLGAPARLSRTEWRRQRNAARYHEHNYAEIRRQRKAAARASVESPLQRGRRVLAPVQSEWDRLAAEAAELGLEGVALLDWWYENRHRVGEAFA